MTRYKRRPVKVRPRTELIYTLRAEVPRGFCIYCERRLTGLQKLRCASVECRRLYHRDYESQARKLAKEARLSQDVDTEEA